MIDLLKYPVYGSLVLILQIMLVGNLAIRGITPDFLVVFIIYAGLMGNPVLVIWLGFFLGFFFDAVSGTHLFGLTALALAITGYLSGLFQVRIVRIPILLQYLLHLGFVLVYFSILVFVYLQDADWNLGSVFFLVLVPRALYTYFILVASFILLRVGAD